jgi:hypothetical protein
MASLVMTLDSDSDVEQKDIKSKKTSVKATKQAKT